MIRQDPTLFTHQDLLDAAAAERVPLVESFLVASLSALRPPDAGAIDASARLADLGVDSLQVVELKFALDQLIGTELDVGIIIENPTIHELAGKSLSACGL